MHFVLPLLGMCVVVVTYLRVVVVHFGATEIGHNEAKYKVSDMKECSVSVVA